MSSEFVWRMEDVLDLYEEPYDPKHPVVCFDERPFQLIGEVHHPLPAKPGQPMSDEYFPEAETVKVVMDKLAISSVFESFIDVRYIR